MTKDYEYRGLVAEAWDLLRGDTSTWADRAFYRGIIERNKGPVLDVGCGTGRLLLEYLAQGLDIDGVDNSPEMLAICQNKARDMALDISKRLFEQKMDELSLSRRYATIIVPSSSFQLLTDPPVADKTMLCFFEHLAPGGTLVMSFMSKLWRGKRMPAQMEWSGWSKIAEQQRPDCDGAALDPHALRSRTATRARSKSLRSARRRRCRPNRGALPLAGSAMVLTDAGTGAL